MILKANGEFLDFNDDVEMEKQIKLFEDISTTDGDFSYAFELEKTLENKRILQNPMPDNIAKLVYQQIPAVLLSDSGAELYKGFLRIERVNEVYECSFFAGNNNWFARITGQMSDLDLSAYDIENTEINIIDSWENDDGLIFPLLDNGGLITRSYHQLKIEDFVGAFYVKTLFEKIFTEAGIKIQGELLKEWRFQRMVCVTSSNNDQLIQERSSFVNKNVTQVVADNTITKVTFNDDSTDPFFDGSANNFDLANSQYVADVKMTVRVDLNLSYHTAGEFTVVNMWAYLNGIEYLFKSFQAIEDLVTTSSLTGNITMNAGDIIEIYIYTVDVGGEAGTIMEATLKITPTYIYKTLGSTAVPNWSKQKFVSNVIKIFNTLTYYDPGSSTITFDLFEKIKSKPIVDLSEHISNTDIDYSEFISDYAQRSKFGYQEVEFEELKTYNKGKFFKYGQGSIEVDNDFLEQEKDILTSDFSNPIAYVNATFDMSIEKTNILQLEEGDNIPFDDVANDGMGNAAFQNPALTFRIGDLVRIKESTNPLYNGDWIVQSTPSGHITFQGLPFDTAASGTLIKLNYKYSQDDNVFLFLNIPSYPRANFSGASIVFDSGGFYPILLTDVALAYFDLINTGKPVNSDFKLSLSFGGIDDPLRYQVTMIESYFRLFSRVLNDPVKLFETAQIPYSLFHRINFLSPITIKTLETQNMYYMNRITGYKDAREDCTLELIKLP